MSAATIGLSLIGGRQVAVRIPEGAIVQLAGISPDDRKLISVVWDRRTVMIFVEDVWDRGEEISEGHSDCLLPFQEAGSNGGD